LFNASTVTVKYKDCIVLTGTRLSITRLWNLNVPRTASAPPLSVADTPEIASTTSTANAVINNPNLAERIAFYHASMFSPALSTWCAAIDAGHFTSWPELTSVQVRRYPPQSIAMVKGHLDQERANVRSTKLTAEKHEITTSHPVPDPTPESLAPEPAALKTHFLYADCQPATGQIYTDPTGRFLVPSVSRNSYILVVYDYDSTFIHAEPMKNRTKEVILAAYQRVISLLKSHGLQPKLQKLDNKASQVLQQYMVEEHINFQLVPPGLHRQQSAQFGPSKIILLPDYAPRQPTFLSLCGTNSCHKRS
jgi:hypothetical protein